jgi:GNAT superfamily N-acetyltransferase
MAVREKRVVGLDALALATTLLHRVRQEDPAAGLWEAADLHWWWRTPRASDLTEQVFWIDDHGPLGAVWLTDWTHNWSCDPIIVPHRRDDALDAVWRCALELVDHLPSVEVLARDDDAQMLGLLAESGFHPTGECSGNTWMPAGDRPTVPPLPDGFRLVVRADSDDEPHPMQRRNGYDVETRLRETSLYDPELDLAVIAPDGDVAAYALFWNDFVTGVGMVEPMRTEDEYQRLGLARTLLASGCDRLARRGAQRLKVGFDSEAARRLYVSAGFHTSSTDQLYRRKY